MGLWSLYYALASTIQHFRYLRLSLVFLLVFVGIKMILLHHYPLPNSISLGVIATILAGGVVASVLGGGQDAAPLASPLAEELADLLRLSYRRARRLVVLVIGSTLLLIGAALLVLPGPGFCPPGWLEVRSLRTVLGDHLFVRTESGRAHHDPQTLEARPLPDEAAIRHLVDDAIAASRACCGEVVAVTREEGEAPSASIRTTTGVEISLDWRSLDLTHSGRDTRRIDGLYRVHYLQWTGMRALGRVLGVVGLALLVVLSALGSSPRVRWLALALVRCTGARRCDAAELAGHQGRRFRRWRLRACCRHRQ